MSTPTMPEGALMWGQEGVYDAIDDRQVISALADRRFGLARPPALTAGTGLTLNIGPWVAIVNCGDGTDAVIGSREQISLDMAAGGASARTDVIWADLDVDGGTFRLAVITPLDTTGRAGVELGRVVANVNASTVAAMTLTPAAQAHPRVRAMYSISNHTVNSQAQTHLNGGPRFQVVAGKKYWFEATFYVTGLSTYQGYMTVGGTALVNNFRNIISWLAGGTEVRRLQMTWGSNSNMMGPTLVNNATYVVRMVGFFDCTASGDFGVSVAASFNANAFRVEGATSVLLVEMGPGAQGAFP